LPFQVDANNPGGDISTMFNAHSVHVAMLPYLEQQPLFNAVNFNMNVWNVQNYTIHGVAVAALVCPSDPEAAKLRTVPDGSMQDPGAVDMRYTSYAGNAGTWFLWYQQDPIPQHLMNGLFHIKSAVTMADIKDGTSQTFAFGERAHTLLDDQSALSWHWWTSGNYGDTLFCTLFPMNPFRKVNGIYINSGDARADAYISGASSMHPGGCNFAFADGHVKFILESVNAWPPDSNTGLPDGVTFDPNGPYKVDPKKAKPGVYQALSTRKGREVVSTSDY
jgi:prepilin-type processing-associated H-X9-DG protein